MAMNLAEKILAKAAGRARVSPGEILTCCVDLAMIHDSGGPRRVGPILKRWDVGIFDPSRVVLISDHYVPAIDDETRRIADITRRFATEHKISNFHEAEGICHVVLPERGHLKPGMFAVGGDSHSPTGGAFGVYMFGIGATEMAGVLATGEIWVRVPQTIEISFDNAFGPGVVAKDVMLFLCGQLGMDGGRSEAVQFSGSAIRALSMQERMTLSNMTAELGGQVGLIEPDATTAAYIHAAGADAGPLDHWKSDADAVRAAHYTYDAAALAPHVAAPHSPANSAPIGDMDAVKIDVAYIGACTGAKLVDLRMAAEVLKGRKIASHVSLMVAPASRRDQDAAAREGTLQILVEAGAKLYPNACGICAGYGGTLDDDVTCLSSTARNFKGRMGAASSRVYLGSPYTVAASAVAGHIVDPRPMLAEGKRP